MNLTLYDFKGAGGGRAATAAGILPSAKVVRVGSAEACDRPWVTYRCPVDGTAVSYKEECDDERGCSDHSRVWAWGQGARAAWRLDHVRLLYGLSAPRHVVVSFEDQVPAETASDLAAQYSEAWEVLDAWGVYGGALVYHPERHEGETFTGEGPHFHGLVWGPARRWEPEHGGNVGVLAEGVVVKFIGMRSELQRVVAYLVNHAGYVPKKHVVRYYGLAAYNMARGVPDLPPGEAGIRCPLCGCLMTREDGSFDPVYDPVSRAWVGGWSASRG